ncbi:SMI1/KNR4 family protein [Actinoplanes sp. L3-i22]|uniref:SMI1/KNR4 family protein n=1 Tax=Actinoplanes sp. L3-i22 TaxID=2836373 RepID=UPI001C79226B|nr:SMI1/KNR4 family protein [Actinoplanes sp. L3-i22]BCY11960.1 SMI1/KNR4 family protein [Actinoplanes sp. L3-i22]
MALIYDFATWAPLVELMHSDGDFVAGYVGRGSWSVPVAERRWKVEFAAAQRVMGALREAGLEQVAFVLDEGGLHLIDFGAAVEVGVGMYPGALLLVEGAVPEPWRRLPVVEGAVRGSGAADAGLLGRALVERLRVAVGVSSEAGSAVGVSSEAGSAVGVSSEAGSAVGGSLEADLGDLGGAGGALVGASASEIAAVEERLGVVLPAELKAIYQVYRGQDPVEGLEASARVASVMGFELLSIDDVYVADAASRPCPWVFAASEAVVTGPDAAVQGVAGSPGWIAFAGNGGGDRYAIDLTPGPGGHLGQVILISHEEYVGASLVADSLTELIVHGRKRAESRAGVDLAPVVATVNYASVNGVEGVVHPDLEVLTIGVWKGEPIRLAPVVGLPRLRTLSAYPGTLADPLEITRLTDLEFLELGPEDWRVLLDAGAVPRTLKAAAINARNRHPLMIMELANELLALWNRPPMTRTVVATS